MRWSWPLLMETFPIPSFCTALQGSAHQGSALHCRVMQCRVCALQCRVVQWTAVHGGALHCSSGQHCSTMQCNTVKFRALWYNAVQCSILVTECKWWGVCAKPGVTQHPIIQTLYIVHCTQNNVQYTMYKILYIVQHTPHTIHSSNVKWRLYL